jgi:hypothetical protein
MTNQAFNISLSFSLSVSLSLCEGGKKHENNPPKSTPLCVGLRRREREKGHDEDGLPRYGFLLCRIPMCFAILLPLLLLCRIAMSLQLAAKGLQHRSNRRMKSIEWLAEWDGHRGLLCGVHVCGGFGTTQ